MAQKPDHIGREILPIPDRPSKGKMALDARKAEFFSLESLPERMAFPTDLLICERLRRLRAGEEDGLDKFCREYKAYLKI